MSTGYGWEGIRQVCVTLLGARHVPERLCGGSVYLGRYNKCWTFMMMMMMSVCVEFLTEASIKLAIELLLLSSHP